MYKSGPAYGVLSFRPFKTNKYLILSGVDVEISFLENVLLTFQFWPKAHHPNGVLQRMSHDRVSGLDGINANTHN